MKLTRTYNHIIAIFCLSLLIRFIYNITIARNYQPIYDAGLYDTIARNLLDHHCYCLTRPHSTTVYPTVSRPPLWAFIITIIYFFTGKEEFYARLFYSFLGSGTCVLIYLFARDLFNRKIALFCGIVAALYTGLFIYDGWLYTESLYTFCTTAFIYALYRLQQASCSIQSSFEQKWPARLWQEISRRRWSILCGIFIGLAALTRPNGILLLCLVGLWATLMPLARILPWQTVLKSVFTITCIAAIIIAPWTYRNYLVTHDVVLVSTGMGEVLIGSYNDTVAYGDPAYRGRWVPPAGTRVHDSFGYTPETDKTDTARAFVWIRIHISTIPYLFGIHFVNMWIPYSYAHGLPFEQDAGRAAAQIILPMINIMTYLVIFFAVLGISVTWRQKKHQLLVVYLFITLTIVQNMIFYSDMRFRAPVEPFLVILTGGFFWCLTHKKFNILHIKPKKSSTLHSSKSIHQNSPT